MIFSNYKLRTKLGSSFCWILLLTAGMGAFSVSQLARINDKTQDLAGNWLPSVEAVGAIGSAIAENRRAEAQHVLAIDQADMLRQEQRLAADRKLLAKTFADYEPLISSPEERDLAQTLKRQMDAYLVTSSKLLRLASDPTKTQETRAYFGGESREALVAAMSTSEQLTAINSAGAKQARQVAEATYTSSRNWVIGLVLAAMAVAAGLALWVSHLIAHPIAQAVNAARRMAAGDLSVEFEIDGKDEAAQLLTALSTMQGNLASIVSEVRQNAEGVATASAQIAQGNNDLSGRTEAQASALEETAASMEELSSTVKQNADNAKQANQLAQGASDIAIRGGDAVGEVVQTMSDINASSKKITDIIAVIDGIAFQTNILALNAAVEAARAGEQGRGFAVVASEVRSLAQRSAEAAREIKTLISASVERVAKGTALVDQAGVTMQEVVSSIRRVTDIMGEISAASSEQSAGVAQIGEAVTQMDQATQQNAALVEESAAAAESLKSQAHQLVDAVAVFKVSSINITQQPTAAPLELPVERRGPHRAANVSRIMPGAVSRTVTTSNRSVVNAAHLKTGTDDWESF